MAFNMQRSDSDKVISMVLTGKRRRHVHPRYLKLLRKHEIENGVIDHTVNDLFLDIQDELKLDAPKLHKPRRSCHVHGNCFGNLPSCRKVA